MRFYGFNCKTPGCEALLKIGDLPEDTPRAMHVPINLGADTQRLGCPDCKQAYDYSTSDLKTFSTGGPHE